jgi:hypothetical protein
MLAELPHYAGQFHSVAVWPEVLAGQHLKASDLRQPAIYK